MRFHTSPRTTLAAAVLVTGAVYLSACSAGSLGSSDDESGKTTISFLTNNDPNNVKIAEAVIKAFEAATTTSTSSSTRARAAATATTW